VNTNIDFSKLKITGPQPTVAAAIDLLQKGCGCGSRGHHHHHQSGNGGANSQQLLANPTIGADLAPAPPPAAGALAGVSSCNTIGAPIKMCAPGTFPAYTIGAPFYLTHTPTGRDFDVPCAVAVKYFSDIATLCESNKGIMASVQVGNPASSCRTTQISATADGNSAHFVLEAEPGCEQFTPGVLLSIGFSNNTSPGPVTVGVSGTGSDGCLFSNQDIRGTMQALGQGTLALLFSCVQEQRLYPIIARLRKDNILAPSGTSFPGIGTLTADAFNPDESLTIDVTGPAGMTLTVETLTWNMPTLSCLWTRALGPLGL
jgi:hypothetical protein